MNGKRIEAVKVRMRGRVGYRVTWNGEDYSLVRSTARPERLYALNSKLEHSTVAGFKWFSDAGGQLRGLTA